LDENNLKTVPRLPHRRC